jgi:hypothetical protein
MILSKIFRRNRNSEAASIGVIGRSDRPAIIKLKRIKEDDNDEFINDWRQALDKCKEQVLPREKAITGDELKQHLIEQYDAMEFDLSEGKKRMMMINVLSDFYPEALPHPPIPAENASERKLIRWARNDLKMLEAALRDIREEEYGLHFIGLRAPRSIKTEPYYKALEQECVEGAGTIEFLVELSTGYLHTVNSCAELSKEILIWRGLTKEDKENCTPAFISYADILFNENQVRDCAASQPDEKAN